MINNTYRVARSTSSDQTLNTLNLTRRFSFAVMEFLDTRDSKHFREQLLKKKWSDLTPDAHQARKTYYEVRPPPEELDEFAGVEPDWFYISGHYAPTYFQFGDWTLFALPAGFFNEPFHMEEWGRWWRDRRENEREKSPAKEAKRKAREAHSLFMQCETLADPAVFTSYMEQKLIEYFSKGVAKAKTEAIAEDWRYAVKTAPELVAAWREMWMQPGEDLVAEINPTTIVRSPVTRGLLFRNVWPSVKVLLLVGCNTLTWRKTIFNEAFPNALVLGYIDKNPADGTPHIKAFLENVFKDVKEAGDPRLVDHDFIAKAWMDVHHRRGLSLSKRLGYLTPDGRVFAVGKRKETREVGTANDILFRTDKPEGTHIARPDIFGLTETTNLVLEP